MITDENPAMQQYDQIEGSESVYSVEVELSAPLSQRIQDALDCNPHLDLNRLAANALSLYLDLMKEEKPGCPSLELELPSFSNSDTETGQEEVLAEVLYGKLSPVQIERLQGQIDALGRLPERDGWLTAA